MGSLKPSILVTHMGFILCLALVTHRPSSLALAELLAQPVNTVPAFPVQTEAETCRLELSDELFGGVKLACGGKSVDRSRCCPVLAAWLFSAHARIALQVTAPAPEAENEAEEQPMMPDDSQKCVNSLQSSLQNRSINIVWPNSTCDPIMCFCGIRLHKVSSLSCPAAFNVTVKNHTAAPTAAVRNLEKNCRNSSYAGCTRCLGALGKLKADRSNDTSDDRAAKMFNRDCQLMGLTWLLARDKAAYIPTVSAVLRAIMYSAHPSHHKSTCSPDQENMPLAVDSLELESSDSPPVPAMPFILVPVLPLIMLGRLQRVWSCLAQSVPGISV